MKRDFLFVAERLANLLDENRLAILARQHGIRQKRDDGGVAKTFATFLRRLDESTLGRALVESAVLLVASRGNATQALRDAATTYKVDTDAIAAMVRKEFAAKDKAKAEKKPAAKSPAKQPKTGNESPAA